MEYGSHIHDHAIEEDENANMEETVEITKVGHGHDVSASGQSAGSRPATNVSCGCTGGGNWIFMAIAAGLVGLYVLASMLR